MNEWPATPAQLALAAFFVLAGLAAWWQLRQLAEPRSSLASRAHLPDAEVIAFSALETDAHGVPSRRLSAEVLRQYLSDDRAEFEQPRLTLYSEQGVPWKVRAREGIALEQGEEIQLRGAVELERAASASAPATHIRTEQLRIWHARAYAETEQPVRIASGDDWLSANGMRLWYGEPSRATFHGRTQMLLSAPAETTQ